MKNTVQAAALGVASLALAVDALVYGMAVPVLPEIASTQGAHPLGVGVMFAVYAAALVAVTPLAGLWVDRRGNRAPLLLGVMGLAAATLLFAFTREPALLTLGRALQGLAAGIVWTAGLALIAATHPPGDRGKAMGYAISSFALGTLLGPPLGGLLNSWGGPLLPFLVAAALAVGDGVARWVLIPRELPVQRASIGEVRGRAGLPLVVVLTATGGALISFLEPILPLQLFTTENAGSAQVGLVFGAAGLTACLVPPLAGMALRWVSPQLAAAAGCLIAAAALAILGGTRGAFQATVGLVLVVLGASVVLTPTITMMSRIAELRDPPAYGAIYAVYTLAYSTGLAVAPLAAGWLMQESGFAAATRTAAAGAALTAVAALAMGRRHRSVSANSSSEAETRIPNDSRSS